MARKRVERRATRCRSFTNQHGTSLGRLQTRLNHAGRLQRLGDPVLFKHYCNNTGARARCKCKTSITPRKLTDPIHESGHWTCMGRGRVADDSSNKRATYLPILLTYAVTTVEICETLPSTTWRARSRPSELERKLHGSKLVGARDIPQWGEKSPDVPGNWRSEPTVERSLHLTPHH